MERDWCKRSISYNATIWYDCNELFSEKMRNWSTDPPTPGKEEYGEIHISESSSENQLTEVESRKNYLNLSILDDDLVDEEYKETSKYQVNDDHSM